MKRLSIGALFAGLLAIGLIFAPTRAAQTDGGTSGHGKMKFKVLYTSDHLPPEAQKVLTSAHGGFTVDLRPGKGETYFTLKGAGIIQISADLKTTRMIATPPEMKKTNLHNSTIWYAPDGSPHLLFPDNEAGHVFIATLDGKLEYTLNTPEAGTDLGNPIATDYFKGRGNFMPTDVEQLDGMLYITTGYSNLDFVLTARILSANPVRAVWNDLAFGGRGTGPGQFGTGHGITVPPGTKRLDVADRPNAEIDRFTRYGQYLSTLRMPQGSLPCDIYYLGKYAIVCCLDAGFRGGTARDMERIIQRRAQPGWNLDGRSPPREWRRNRQMDTARCYRQASDEWRLVGEQVAASVEWGLALYRRGRRRRV